MYDMLLELNTTISGAVMPYSISYEYDLYGRLIKEKMSDLWTKKPLYVTTYEYDDYDNMIKKMVNEIEGDYKWEENYYYN
jgi:hypothetical protein